MLHKKVLEIKTDDSILAATVQFLISLLGFDKLKFFLLFFLRVLTLAAFLR